MALATVNFFSNALMRNVTVNVIVPVDKYDFNGVNCSRKKPFKTLYLLHGIFGDYTDWVNGTRILSWAQEKDLAVVMPSGYNSFYVDGPIGYGAKYGTFIGKELVEMTRAMFPLSHEREDTFIGGLSMGGYGAIINGLNYNDVFGRIIALSSALDLSRMVDSTNDAAGIIGRRDYYESIFGDLDKLEGSNMDYYAMIRKLKSEGQFIPKIYMACGTEDFLIEANRRYRDFLAENDIDFVYNESKGIHNWIFWDEYICKALEWLPLGEGKEGVSSGNVQ